MQFVARIAEATAHQVDLHKINTVHAAQQLGKFRHEVVARRRFPWRALVVGPWLPVIASVARVMDPDPTERLSVLVTKPAKP
jgi:hypothetical protein